MLEHLKILTVTHRHTRLEEIGDFVIKAENEAELITRLESIKAQFCLEELFYLPTCNRVMYFFVTPHVLDHSFAAHFLQAVNPQLPLHQLENIEEKTLLLKGRDAMAHLFDVASSIDSLVVGERQILGQIRDAYDQCQRWNLTGDTIRLAIQQAVVSAKEVYATTKIGAKPVSIVSLAIQKMMQANLPKDARILLIGAGQTNTLVAKFLAKHQFEKINIFNRSIGKAEELAKMLNGNAFLLSELPNYTEGFDCMIVCTGATEAIISTDLYTHLLQGDTDRKVVIDLAIPNNVDEDVVAQCSLQYIKIEGLRQLAKENLAFRELEIKHAHLLLAPYLDSFPSILKQRQLEIALRNVPQEIKAIKAKAVNEVFRKEVDSLDDSTRELLDRMLSYMEKKCIGIPMKAAREVVL
ncbi:MAG: glutamyl-tRNA reductase [Saprospiraceae bacterium]|nr:MAG: glutamyl-tRNA reductase [Saprospiraceae bacterium]